ncbi:T-complex protein 1 subunit delta [Trifolium pratense]|uniref:T-complex protein 1 subunit delta n=1 Tax=Trifolium pratense TaxID=57577 RepID=A0A2K3M9A6_TRIPR|nr:T-complex protein 1 subunit delta [Trifolium pratense]PNX87374.1 T-complex protein 1 subunit delta [Trifolium pratense]
MNRYNNQPLENVFQAKMNIRSSNPQQEGRRDSFRGQPSNRGHGKHSGNRGRGERRQGNSNSYCLICKKPGHESKDCRFRCTRCKIPNHSDRDCWHKKKEGDERMKGINFSAEDDAHKLFSTMINDKKSGEIWFLHSGCSNHVIGNQNIFEELNKNYSSRPRELSSVGMDICAGAGVRTPDPGHSTYSP